MDASLEASILVFCFIKLIMPEQFLKIDLSDD